MCRKCVQNIVSKCSDIVGKKNKKKAKLECNHSFQLKIFSRVSILAKGERLDLNDVQEGCA